jgi:hypothetical protein
MSAVYHMESNELSKTKLLSQNSKGIKATTHRKVEKKLNNTARLILYAGYNFMTFRFQALSQVNTIIPVIWDMMICYLTANRQILSKACILHIQASGCKIPVI